MIRINWLDTFAQALTKDVDMINDYITSKVATFSKVSFELHICVDISKPLRSNRRDSVETITIPRFHI